MIRIFLLKGSRFLSFKKKISTQKKLLKATNNHIKIDHLNNIFEKKNYILNHFQINFLSLSKFPIET